MKNKMFIMSAVIIGMILFSSFSSFAGECKFDVNEDGVVNRLDRRYFLWNFWQERGRVDCEISCSSDSFSKCDEECVDTNTDERHCGECFNECLEGEICTSGFCEIVCGGSSTACTGTPDYCADLNTDENNCGACGNSCAQDDICRNGTCEETNPLPAVIVDCGGTLTMISSDEDNCGECGNTCEVGEICNEGICQETCPPGQIFCGGQCINPDTDENFCGAYDTCDNGEACVSGETCQAGVCELGCPSGQIVCGDKCIDPYTDEEFCGANGDCGTNSGVVCASGETCQGGACELSCPPGQVIFMGQCINPDTDNNACGSSRDDCTATGRICESGSCVCPSPLYWCNGSCVDIDYDPDNCGACNSACSFFGARETACNDGNCIYTCEPEYADCTGGTNDGCETNIMSNTSNCGRCGRECMPRNNAEVYCSSGECYFTCLTGYYDCDLQSDNGCESSASCTF